MADSEFVFTVQIAGVPAEIRCRNRENRDFFRDYMTDRDPEIRVEVTEEDDAYTRGILTRFNGIPAERYEEAFLENTSIRNVLSRALLDYGVLMIHGSCLCMDGEAYLFTAPGGTGKSTHARFWRETFGERVRMLNDDRPMVRIADGRATAYGTPWDGKHRLSRNASAPLKAVISLRRAEENRIEPISKADAFPVVMGQTAWMRTGPQKPRAILLLSGLLDAVGLYRLGCNLDPDAARVAWEGMRQA